jgi:hypothetical protein
MWELRWIYLKGGIKLRTLIHSSLLVFVTCSLATAQFSGQLSTAETVVKGTSFASGFVAVYEDGFGVLGQYRAGIGGYSDLGGKIGLIDFDPGDQTGFLIGLDYKYQIMEVRIEDPIDMSLGGMMDLSIFEDFKILSFGGFLAGSHPIPMRSGRNITPYGRLILRFDRSDPDFGESDTDFNIGLNAGGKLEVSGSTSVFLELQLDEQTALYLGVNFGL